MSGVIHCGRYDVVVGNDAFLQLEKFLGHRYAASRKIILVDAHTRLHCLPLLLDRVPALKDAEVIEMNPGEANKSLQSCEKIWQRLSDLRANRRSLWINLGGGVVCDTGGFAASVFLRGIDFINIPTTLLSMVDSSVGGKTGINFSGLKNQVGTFTRPAGVFISPVWLSTLPEREIKSGFAEMIKHALISSREKWEELSSIRQFDELDWIQAIRESVILKNKIVNADFRDRQLRKTLNFGHTIGHALESVSVKAHADPLKHGEAIALGMIGELYLSGRLLHFPPETSSAIISFLLNHYRHVPVGFEKTEVLERMKSDKKNERGEINFVLLQDIGNPVINQHATDEMIFQALDFIFEHAGKASLPS